MKKFMIILILILSIGILAVVTKPSEDHFQEWIKIKTESNTKTSDSWSAKLLRKGFQTQVKYSTNYKDKTFYSIVETRMLDQEMTYFGVFGMWFHYKR